jgi:hypothetical protein
MHNTKVVLKDGRTFDAPIHLFRPAEGFMTVPRNLGKSGFDEITPVLCRYTQRTFNGLTRTGIAAMLLSGKVS